MFVPQPYREPDSSWMSDLVRGNPLALMVSSGAPDAGPFATHLPVIPSPTTGGDWPHGLAGVTLLGHMNRQNPHWSALTDEETVLLTFTGPHAYVSPTVYGFTPAAPTWDFTSVHVRGTVEKIESEEETLAVVSATVRAFERDFGADWDPTESVCYFQKILPGVGAFRFHVTGADGMFKLSQEQAPETRGRVRESFAASPCTRHRSTADLMERLR